MRLQAAIQIVSQPDKTNLGITLKELQDAEKLLIEAGKRLQKLRLHYFDSPRELLPGETEK